MVDFKLLFATSVEEPHCVRSISHMRLGSPGCLSHWHSAASEDCSSHCSQTAQGLPVHVIHVCMVETCEPCVPGWDKPPDPHSLSHDYEKEFQRVWPGPQHLVPCSQKGGGGSRGRWKELRLSIQALVRETTGKLMWQYEPTREAGKREWALSFFGSGWKKREPTP